MKTISTLVALAPIFAVTLMGLLVTVGPRFKSFVLVTLRKRNVVETLKELLAHAAFFGSAVVGFLGLKHETEAFVLAAALWFTGLLALAFALAGWLDKLEEEEAEENRELLMKILEGISEAKAKAGSTEKRERSDP